MKKTLSIILALLLPLSASAVFIVDQGGTGSTTLSGLLKGNGKSMVQTATAGTDYVLPSALSSYLTLASWYATTTDGLDEGLTNLYFTNPRVLTYLDTLSKGYFFSTTSADAWDATKDRWGTTSADYWIGTKNTDALAQGSTNKYFANSLVDTWLGTKSLGIFFSTTSADHWYTVQSKASSTLLGDTNTWSTTNQFAKLTFTNATGTRLSLFSGACDSSTQKPVVDAGGNWSCGTDTSGVGTIATSSAETANEIPFYTSTNGYPSLLGTNSDFTYAPAPSSILSVQNITIGSEIRGNSWRDISGVTGFDVDTSNVNATIGSGGYFTIKDNVTALQGSISLSGISANRTYYLPDIDGTLVTDGVISTLVPYSGAVGNLDMGTWNVTTPQINSVDTPLLLLGSDSATLDTPGNTITVRGGKGNGTGDGAYAYVVGGDSGDTEGIGGGAGLIGGYAYGASHGGNIELSVGGSATGDNGKFIFNQNLVGGALGILDFSLLGTSEKTFQFPNQSGTLALLSDVGAASASSTLLGDNNLFSGNNIFNSITRSTSTQATSTNFFSTYVVGTNGTITNLLATNSTTTNSTSTTGYFSGVLSGAQNGFTGRISPVKRLSYITATSTAWTATTSGAYLPPIIAPFAGTIQTAQCSTDTGTLNVDIYHTSTHLALFNASTTVGTITFSSNNTITNGEKIYVSAGTPASSPTVLSCTLSLTESL